MVVVSLSTVPSTGYFYLGAVAHGVVAVVHTGGVGSDLMIETALFVVVVRGGAVWVGDGFDLVVGPVAGGLAGGVFVVVDTACSAHDVVVGDGDVAVEVGMGLGAVDVVVVEGLALGSGGCVL